MILFSAKPVLFSYHVIFRNRRDVPGVPRESDCKVVPFFTPWDCCRETSIPSFASSGLQPAAPPPDHRGRPESARTALGARSLETIHFGPEYCRRALSLTGRRWGDGNEHTADEASSCRGRSEAAYGRCNSGHGKGSGSSREDCLQGRGRHNRDGIHDFVTLDKKQHLAPSSAASSVFTYHYQGVSHAASPEDKHESASKETVCWPLAATIECAAPRAARFSQREKL